VPEGLWSSVNLPDAKTTAAPESAQGQRYLPAGDLNPLSARRGGSSSLPEVQEAHQVDWQTALQRPCASFSYMGPQGVTLRADLNQCDFRLGDMFHNVTGPAWTRSTLGRRRAGWNRWAADTSGFRMHGFLVTAAIGRASTLDAYGWRASVIARSRSRERMAPATCAIATCHAPLFDEYFEPFWSVLQSAASLASCTPVS